VQKGAGTRLFQGVASPVPSEPVNAKIKAAKTSLRRRRLQEYVCDPPGNTTTTTTTTTTTNDVPMRTPPRHPLGGVLGLLAAAAGGSQPGS